MNLYNRLDRLFLKFSRLRQNRCLNKRYFKAQKLAHVQFERLYDCICHEMSRVVIRIFGMYTVIVVMSCSMAYIKCSSVIHNYALYWDSKESGK